MSKGHSFERVDQIISSSLKNLHINEHFPGYVIWRDWKKIAGDPLCTKVIPSSFVKKTLTLSVVHSSWLHAMQFQKKEVLDRIHSFFPDLEIDEIKLKLASKDFAEI